MRYSDLEPLLPDQRVAEIEGRVRAKVPNLPYEAQFVSFIQPPRWGPNDKGIEMRQPAMAMFAVLSPNPSDPTHAPLIEQTGIPLDQFRRMEKDRGHYANVPDIALFAFGKCARAHAQKVADARDLLPPTPEKDLPS